VCVAYCNRVIAKHKTQTEVPGYGTHRLECGIRSMIRSIVFPREEEVVYREEEFGTMAETGFAIVPTELRVSGR